MGTAVQRVRVAAPAAASGLSMYGESSWDHLMRDADRIRFDGGLI